MPAFANSTRLRRFSNAMVIVTSIGMVLIAVAMILVFVIPDWTRNLLMARLGEAGRHLTLTPGRPCRRCRHHRRSRRRIAVRACGRRARCLRILPTGASSR